MKLEQIADKSAKVAGIVVIWLVLLAIAITVVHVIGGALVDSIVSGGGLKAMLLPLWEGAGR